MSTVTELADNVFLQRHPLSMLGCQMGRNVTVLRLSSGKLLIHSTANFSGEDVAAIQEIGQPAWLLEATNIHDTYAKAGREAFPNIPYLTPPEFKNAASLGASPIASLQGESDRELEIFEIAGMPKLREHAVFHAPTKTLIIADLLFNFPDSSSWWTRAFLRTATGIKHMPAMSRLMRFYIKDHEAFQQSIDQIGELDFERVLVGHGNPLENGAKATLLKAVAL